MLVNNKKVQSPAVTMPQADALETLSALYYDMNTVKSLLWQTKELPYSSEIFNEGEKGSIDAMLNKIVERMEFIRELQKIL